MYKMNPNSTGSNSLATKWSNQATNRNNQKGVVGQECSSLFSLRLLKWHSKLSTDMLVVYITIHTQNRVQSHSFQPLLISQPDRNTGCVVTTTCSKNLSPTWNNQHLSTFPPLPITTGHLVKTIQISRTETHVTCTHTQIHTHARTQTHSHWWSQQGQNPPFLRKILKVFIRINPVVGGQGLQDLLSWPKNIWITDWC